MALADRGVAFIVVAPDDRVLVIQEKETNPAHGKIAGQWSMPMETVWPGEPDKQALERLLTEELPGMAVAIGPCCFGRYQVIPGVWVHLYIGRTESFSLPSAGAAMDGVSNHCWVPLGQATGLWLRRGAWEMLQDFRHGQQGSIREKCRAVEPLPDQFLFPRQYAP